ncbi:MAG TPA: NDP-sugar synthase [Candidatus Binataceae bacterium]|nr:NDP-sugar synthase [Candidatus Binataceae bacterium]
MKALVLSAGYGERLRPLTETTPKPLLEVGGRPLIHYPLLMLRAAGVREVAINVHHMAAQIESALGDGRTLQLAITYSREPALRGTGGPLLDLTDYFAGEPFIIVNCDTVMDLDLVRMIEFHDTLGGLATLALGAAGDPEAYSRIEIDAARRIRRMRLLKGRTRGEFADYPATLSEEIALALTPYMYCGVMICAPAILAAMPSKPSFSLISDLLAPLVARKLMGFVHAGFFRTVDDLTGYNELRVEFAAAPPPLRFLRGVPKTC